MQRPDVFVHLLLLKCHREFAGYFFYRLNKIKRSGWKAGATTVTLDCRSSWKASGQAVTFEFRFRWEAKRSCHRPKGMRSSKGEVKSGPLTLPFQTMALP